jgi:hypothetical protein
MAHAAPSEVSTAAAAVVLGASPVTLTNAGPSPAVYTVEGGTVTVVEMDRGEVTADTGVIAGSFFLGAGDALIITYSDAPTVTKFPM